MKRAFFLATVVAASSTLGFGQGVQIPYVKGGDPSEILETRDYGGVWKSGGVPGSPLQIMKASGWNVVRLRVWVNPTQDGNGNVTPAGYCGYDKTVQLAQEAQRAGLRVAIDFHYSDWWADPGHQWAPAAWSSLNHLAMTSQVYSYTKNFMLGLRSKGIYPTFVQPGNEISAGMIWPDGRLSAYDDAEWTRLTDLLKAGVRGIREVFPPQLTRVCLHIDRGGDNGGSRYYMDKFAQYGVDYDVIGLSYYPWWHGTLDQFTFNVNDLARRYNKKILVAETAYPFTLDFTNRPWGHIFGNASQLVPGYPATPEGQRAFLARIDATVKALPNQRGYGVLWWAPAWISTPTQSTAWDNLALFDYQGNALPAMRAFLPSPVATRP